eukprot:gene15467-4648_t
MELNESVDDLIPPPSLTPSLATSSDCLQGQDVPDNGSMEEEPMGQGGDGDTGEHTEHAGQEDNDKAADPRQEEKDEDATEHAQAQEEEDEDELPPEWAVHTQPGEEQSI